MKAKIYTVFLLMLFFTTAFNGQTPKETVFVRTFGGVKFDEARDLTETQDNGLAIVGTSSSFGGGNSSFYLVKTNGMGIHQWSKTYGGVANDVAYSIEQVHNGKDFLLCGYSNSFSAAHDYDGYVVRTDENGNKLWARSYGGADWDFLFGSCPLSDGFLLCGKTTSNALGNADAWLIRINMNGDIVWEQRYGNQQEELFNDVMVWKDSIYAVGKSRDLKDKALLVKFDMNGQVQKDFSYSSNQQWDYEYRGIAISSTGNLLLSGRKIYQDNFSGTVQEALLIQVMDDQLKSILYEDLGGASKVKNAYKMFENSNKDLICVGSVDGGNGGTALLPVQYSSNLNYISSPTYGGPGMEYGYSGLMMKNKFLAFVGSTTSAPITAGNADMYLIILRKDSLYPDDKIQITSFKDTLPLTAVGLTDLAETNNTFLLAPNPVFESGNIYINGLTNNMPYKLTIINSYGILVEEEDRSSNEFYIRKEDFMPGVYYIRISGKNVQAIFKLLIL